MFAGRTWDEWFRQYAESHQHPVNRVCHTVGIPLIAAAIPLFVLGFIASGLWLLALLMFVVGWIFQFVGHWFAGILPRLAIPVRGPQVVVRQNKRARLSNPLFK